MSALPAAAQFSPMFGIAANDYDNDGNIDILMGGNFYQSKPEVGIYDASYGVFLKGDGKGGFISIDPEQSGFKVRGAIRNIQLVNAGKSRMLFVAMNNDTTRLFNFSGK
jgi:hypothetical protein